MAETISYGPSVVPDWPIIPKHRAQGRLAARLDTLGIATIIAPDLTTGPRGSLGCGPSRTILTPATRSCPSSLVPRRVSARLGYVVTSFTWCFVGLFIGFARPELGVARLGFAAGVMTGLSFFDVGVLPSDLLGW